MGGTISGVSQRNLTWEPTGILEYVIPEDWLGETDRARRLAIPPSTLSAGWSETGRMYQGASIASGIPVSS
jgi:hypothetical protein